MTVIAAGRAESRDMAASPQAKGKAKANSQPRRRRAGRSSASTIS